MKLSSKILLGVVVMSFAIGASAQTLKKIKDSGTITIGTRDSSIPFSYVDDSSSDRNSIDICMKAVDAVKASEDAQLKVVLNPVTPGDPVL
jgi:glutamate/aspartate transport system substrate-binding protein